MEAIAFMCGLIAVYYHPVCALILLAVLLYIFRRLQFLFLFALGVVYALIHYWLVQPLNMPDHAVIKRARLQGEVVSTRVMAGQALQFKFKVSELNAEPVKALVLLRCYLHCPDIHTGQTLELIAKIKQPRNLGNPGSFNLVQKLKAKHIDWTGYIQPKSVRLLSERHSYMSITSLRERLMQRLNQGSGSQRSKSLLAALSIGMDSSISQKSWELFRRTGTTHLMVISGAHISLVAGFFYLFTSFLWRRIPAASLMIPAQTVASVMAVISAIVYGMLSGFGVPAQRAVIGCCLLFSRNFLYRPMGSWQLWRYALFLVLLIEPHACLLSGFYLSFVSVAVLLLLNRYLDCNSIKRLFLMQAGCLLALMPLTLFCFSYSAFSGFFANIIAIPFVGFILVPLSLLHCLLSSIGYGLPAGILDIPFNIFCFGLGNIDLLSSFNLSYNLHAFYLPILVSLALFICVFLPKKHLIPALLPILIIALSSPLADVPYGRVRIQVLDVGQGLSVLVSTAKHHLLYDTGMKFYQGSNMGELAVLPYLRYLKVDHLNSLVISHPDLDHRGGMESLQKSLTIDTLYVDDPDYYKQGNNCHLSKGWLWDGVVFEFIPLDVPIKPRNNHSCILRVYTPGSQILFTGDIEVESEIWLVKHFADKLASNILIVPHHGSKTSSSIEFLKHVKPSTAIISSGFDNRYHFPHTEALQHYYELGIKVLNTADTGLIMMEQ